MKPLDLALYHKYVGWSGPVDVDGFDIGITVAFWFLMFGLISAIPLVFCLTANYGKFHNNSMTISIPARWGWVIQESPAVFAFLAPMFFHFRATGSLGSPVQLILTAMWLWHYAYRAFIYPFKLSASGKPLSVFGVVAPAVLFCTVNGWLNGYFIYHLGHVPDLQKLPELARFVAGIAVFSIGLYINRDSDARLRNLRKPGETGYKIPQGGCFRWVTSANYFGEIIEWCGWALATSNVAGVVFAINTMMNLVPRAFSSHRWYLQKFEDYPRQRKAIVPFVC